jgi:hypothetical protein
MADTIRMVSPGRKRGVSRFAMQTATDGRFETRKSISHKEFAGSSIEG